MYKAMSVRNFWGKTSMIVFLTFFAVISCGDQKNLTVKQLNSIPGDPEWMDPIETENSENITTEFNAARGNSDNMRIAVRKYAYLLTKYPSSPRIPYWLYNSASFYLSLDYDHAAFAQARKILELPDSTPCTTEWRTAQDLNVYKHMARLILLSVLARNNLRDEFISELVHFKPESSADYFSLAKSYMLLDDEAAVLTMLERTLEDKNPDAGFKKSSYTAGAVAIAFAMNSFDKLVEFSQWMFDEGIDSKKYIPGNDRGYFRNQWESTYAIVSKYRALAAYGKLIKFSGLNDGTYQASVRGFMDLIDVTLSVSGGKVETIQAVNRGDDRPFSAFRVIPERITDAQSLKVDAISSATISSSAITAAVAETLLEAQ